MPLLSKEQIQDACKAMRVADLAKATIGDIVLISQYLEKTTGVKFMRLDQGAPGLPINQVGVEAEKRALDQGLGCQYPAAGGVKELKEAASEFVKAFMDVNISPAGCIPTTGSVAGAYGSFIACANRIKGKDKVLLIDPGFPIMKSQLRLIGLEERSFDIYKYRGKEALRAKLEEEMKDGDIAAIMYSNPNNPAWICLEEEELQVIGELADKYDTVVLEDLAYFCMDFRHDLGHPYCAPYVRTVARYTDNYIILLSASKIFSYSGQRIGLACISDSLFSRRYSNLAERFHDSGEFGSTFTASIMYMITSGCTATTQYAYAEMLRRSCEGKIDFVEDTREYARRAKRMKDIMCRNGFHIVYDRDVTEDVGDGFFFTAGYGDMSGTELVLELLCYGMSGIALDTTGSFQNGIRVCTSRMPEELTPIFEERIVAFHNDHKLK